MRGCTCKKAVGFIGLHKKKCPLSKNNQPQSDLHAESGPTLRQFAECVKKVGQLSAVKNFLSFLQKEVDRDRKVGTVDRENAQQLIRTLQNELTNNPMRKPEDSHRMNSSHEAELKGWLQTRLHLYLRAENQSAIKSVEFVAKNLKLPLYRLQCFPSMKESDLWGSVDENGKIHASMASKAFTQGGIFCIENIENAPADLQFWLKSGLDGSVCVAGIASLKRHPDFVMVLTSPVPVRELWSGQVDDAFLTRLVYLDAVNPRP
jgi:hypothetical protein